MSACTFFGHRDCYRLDEEVLRDHIQMLIEQGVDTFYVGNQGHFDGMVYRNLKRLRQIYPHIRVFVVLAYLPTKKIQGQEPSDTIYPEIEGHPKFAIDRRNRWMVHTSDYCLCYINHTWGGAYKYALMAKRRGIKLINLGNAEIEPLDYS